MKKVNTDAVLAAKMRPNDANAATVKDYLKTLLTEMWVQEEGFSGKRPFGNSGWQWELYITLVQAGFVSGEISDEELIQFDEKAADDAILAAIKAL